MEMMREDQFYDNIYEAIARVAIAEKLRQGNGDTRVQMNELAKYLAAYNAEARLIVTPEAEYFVDNILKIYPPTNFEEVTSCLIKQHP